MTVGGLDETSSLELVEPMSSISSSLTIFYDLLPGRERFEHLLADRLFRHARHKVLDDRIIDVRLQQRNAYLAHRLLDIALGQLAARRYLEI